jgi:hypothetical protein
MSEAILMPFQDEPFNGDPYVQVEFLNLKDRFSVMNVIETGSCLFTTLKDLITIITLKERVPKGTNLHSPLQSTIYSS